MTPTKTALTSATTPTSYINVDGTRFAYRELGDPASRRSARVPASLHAGPITALYPQPVQATH
jgi:hypothetical protein